MNTGCGGMSELTDMKFYLSMSEAEGEDGCTVTVMILVYIPGEIS
jgi:hypothetical protein